MKRYVLIVSGITALIAGIFYYMACQLPVSELDDLGPSFWPKILCIVLFLCAVFMAVETLIRYQKEDIPVSFIATVWQKTAWKAIGIIALFTICIKFLGFYLSALLYLPCMLWLLGERNRKVILLLDIGTILVVYIVFCMLLRVQLPEPIFL